MGDEEEEKEGNQKKTTNKENTGPSAGGKRWPRGGWALIQTRENGTCYQKNEGMSCHQLLRKERYLSRDGIDKREKEGVGTLKK